MNEGLGGWGMAEEEWRGEPGSEGWRRGVAGKNESRPRGMGVKMRAGGRQGAPPRRASRKRALRSGRGVPRVPIHNGHSPIGSGFRPARTSDAPPAGSSGRRTAAAGLRI